MNVIRDRADAQWLPYRFHYALFRLLAYVRLQFTAPEPKPGIVMAVQRDQNRLEVFLVSITVLVVGASFFASLFASMMMLPVAFVLGLIITATFIQVQIPVTALIVGKVARSSAIAANSAILMLLVIAAAALLAVGESPVRHVGTVFLFLVAANALASIVVLLMERRMADTVRRFGIEP